MSVHYSLQTKFALPANTHSHRRETEEGVHIEVETTCPSKAALVCNNIEKILTESAHPLPQAQLAIAGLISQADASRTPMACRLSCDL